MRLTDDIIKALHVCIEEGYESVADFAKNANVSANTISKYMRRETKNIQEDTWVKIQPLIEAYLPRSATKGKVKHELELTADQKILLDAFDELPQDVQYQKLMEIIELAKKYLLAAQAEEEEND